jgi:hypothetical protein
MIDQGEENKPFPTQTIKMTKKNSSPILMSERKKLQGSGLLVALVAAALRRTTLMTTTAIASPKTAALFTWAGDAHAQFAVPHVMSVEHANGLLCLSLIAHFNESEALGLSAITVFNQCHRSYSACLKEQAPQIIFRGRIRQISYIQLGFHFFS